jgi:hypothetical protein
LRARTRRPPSRRERELRVVQSRVSALWSSESFCARACSSSTPGSAAAAARAPRAARARAPPRSGCAERRERGRGGRAHRSSVSNCAVAGARARDRAEGPWKRTILIERVIGWKRSSSKRRSRHDLPRSRR